MNRSTPLVRKTALKAQSGLTRTPPAADVTLKPRRATGNRRGESRGRRLVYRRAGGLCEICGRNTATEWHHRKNRSQGGTWDPSNGLHVCTACHRRVTNTNGSKPLYYRLGWCVSREQDPAQVPVQINHGPTTGLYLLDNDGDYAPAYDLEEAI